MKDLKPFDYLSSLQGTGMNLDLATIQGVLKKMHDPQHAYPSILVAGTNGKGSVCAMASSILVSAGYRVGLYTSPHLVDVRERIRYNDRMIAASEMAASISAVRKRASDTLTYFEFLTAVAFLFFRQKKIDVAILEVGMGGRLDATNVVRPIVSVITNIALEHRAYLGTRLAQIAREKGGIIKEGGLCLTAARQQPVLDVLEGTCRERRARLYRVDRDIEAHRDPHSATISYNGLAAHYNRLPQPLRGRHQIRNAAAAVGVMELLAREGWEISEQAIRDGLAKTHWEGRLEVIREAPQVVLDGAHNEAGVSALCRALRDEFSYRHLLIVFGVLNDKSYEGMIKRVAAMADVLFLTRPATDRALPPAEMVASALRYCPDVRVEADPSEALRMALDLAGPKDLICVAGSLYLVGQIKASLGHGI